jgi:hypothetical protein
LKKRGDLGQSRLLSPAKEKGVIPNRLDADRLFGS